jgi:hypothetical protein
MYTLHTTADKKRFKFFVVLCFCVLFSVLEIIEDKHQNDLSSKFLCFLFFSFSLLEIIEDKYQVDLLLFEEKIHCHLANGCGCKFH